MRTIGSRPAPPPAVGGAPADVRVRAVAPGTPAGDLLRRLLYRARFVGDDLRRWPRGWRRRLSAPRRVRLHGVEVVVDQRLGPGARAAIYGGRYERGEAFALMARLQPDDRVVEVGTGIGLLAIVASLRIGSDRVTTYEANPRLLPLIRENCRLNGVEPLVIHGAFGVGRGTALLHLGEEHDDASTAAGAEAGTRSISVPQLDAAEEVRRFHPTFLILDVEGSEREIVPAIDWSPVDKVLLELHPKRYPPADESRIHAAMDAAGFRLDPIVSSRRKLFFAR